MTCPQILPFWSSKPAHSQTGLSRGAYPPVLLAWNQEWKRVQKSQHVSSLAWYELMMYPRKVVRELQNTLWLCFMDTVKKTCLFSIGFYALWLTEFVPSNLVPKSPWKFISQIECNEKYTCATANHLGRVTLDDSNYSSAVCHLDMLMKQWPHSFW